MLLVENLHKNYRSKAVLKGINLQVEPGEVVLLVGKNGEGKTTLLNSIMQLTHYQTGRITLDQQPIQPHLYQRIALVPDKLSINPQFNLITAFDYMRLFYENFDKARAIKWSDQLGLQLNQKIGTLSKGNQAKVNMLLGLCQQSTYLLLDEPLSGLDLLAKEQVLDLFKQVMFEERGILVTTHEVGEIEYLIDRVLVMQDGQILTAFHPETVRAQEQLSISQKIREVLA